MLLWLNIANHGAAGVSAGIDCLDNNDRGGGCQHIQRGADDGLVGAEADACNAEKQGIEHSKGNGGDNGKHKV